ncbi:unnamed protein product [Clonostachys rosea]|uniref:Zn(2)-C6 fungal-type domain-containing protein n=1 Tax=Bionectria ochroleuca TaxID=29856 RepID=A0ABY6UQR0_BIOOC|nr:unnamed protein product [Clonostachys rosea]
MRSPPTSGPRKHRKTFTGCWTCRSRKVKCDEARPTCLQCRSKSLFCQGYGVRLQWVHSSEGSMDHDAPRMKIQRSQVTTNHNCQSFESAEIDDILDSIDAYEPLEPSAPGSGDHFFIHNFGVLNPCSLSQVESLPTTVIPDEQSSSMASDEGSPFGSVTDGHLNAEQLHSSHLDGATPTLFLSEDGSHASQTDLGSSILFDAISPSFFDVPNFTLGEVNDHDSEPLQDPGIVPLQHYEWASTGSALIRNPCSSSLPEQEQFLMYHYTHRAVNLFCVIDNRKSPWKTIHLPRAMQSIGQLSISGSSSSIRNALRNALLSISAFYLSNEGKSRFCSDDAAKWARQATILRGRAIELLKDAVNTDFNTKCIPKYKEFLATMLSMITINVMSGDTSTCGVHLDGAFRFMTQAKTWKTKFSPKALALHRIYFYLQAIYESTALHYHEIGSSSYQSLDAGAQRPLRLTLRDGIDPAATTLSQSARLSIEPTLQMSTYECIYGVPQNLLVLFFESTRLIRRVFSFQKEKGKGNLSAELVSYCDDLEQSIMDWPIDTELQRCRLDTSGPSYDIIRHTTCAFHNALIIYFAQHIRRLSYRYLHQYVQTVLENIEAIEKIKAESRILAAPIYWPAFIAASEAFNETLQNRFKTWYDQVEVYGIEARRSGIQVLLEVWKRGPTTGADMTSRWRMVVEETEAHLMLS